MSLPETGTQYFHEMLILSVYGAVVRVLKKDQRDSGSNPHSSREANPFHRVVVLITN